MAPDNLNEISLDRKPLSWKTVLDNPEDEPMTLCIAADCWIGENPAIAYCCDTRAERGGVFNELVGSEDAWKVREIGRNIALVSGGETPADQLLAACDGVIKAFGQSRGGDNSELLIDGLLRDLEAQAELRKTAITNRWLQFEYGFSLDYFRDNHRQKFEPDMAREIWKRINHSDLESDLLICGFQDDIPVIVKLDRFGKAHWETNCSATGAGSDIAYSFLCQHDWDDRPSLLQCAYYLMEAKTAAERNRHVGEFTYLHFMTSDGKRYELTEKMFDRLDRMAERRRHLKAPDFSMEVLQELTDELPSAKAKD